MWLREGLDTATTPQITLLRRCQPQLRQRRPSVVEFAVARAAKRNDVLGHVIPTLGASDEVVELNRRLDASIRFGAAADTARALLRLRYRLPFLFRGDDPSLAFRATGQLR